MLDRVREAMFSSLGDAVDEARVLDLFSGTGSLGLEALSRGASSVEFFERDRRALGALRDNVQTLAVEEQVRVHPSDALAHSAWPEQVDLVLMDPPYPMMRDLTDRARILAALTELYDQRLTPGGALVLHTHPRDLDAIDLAPREPVERTYGHSTLWYLWKPGE